MRDGRQTDQEAVNECLDEFAPDEIIDSLVLPSSILLRLRRRTRADLDLFKQRLEEAGAIVTERADDGPLTWKGERPSPDVDEL